ncbi:hypothetical protein ACMD2_26914 [Ananas comosus]|uniref:Uncharacterized protein n=1 Tax=Ananas comosus TaxID=4615 RepID=A0A199UMW4_ANACO|nr:hypothetical protein ACMD2_26914 [Ananas comosus]
MGRRSYYNRVSRRWHRPTRGFRLSSVRFSVLRLRVVKLLTLFSLLNRCVQRVRKGIKTGFSSSSRSCSRSSNRRALVVWEGQPEFISGLCVRSNSFYAEAITDCLEFIKRTSMPIKLTNSAQKLQGNFPQEGIIGGSIVEFTNRNWRGMGQLGPSTSFGLFDFKFGPI